MTNLIARLSEVIDADLIAQSKGLDGIDAEMIAESVIADIAGRLENAGFHWAARWLDGNTGAQNEIFGPYVMVRADKTAEHIAKVVIGGMRIGLLLAVLIVGVGLGWIAGAA